MVGETVSDVFHGQTTCQSGGDNPSVVEIHAAEKA